MYSKEPTEIPSKGMQKFVGNFIAKVIGYQRQSNKISTGTPRQYSVKRNRNTPTNKDDIRIHDLDNTSDTPQPKLQAEFIVYTWREIAIIFDQFFFWLFFLITFLLALVFLGILFMWLYFIATYYPNDIILEIVKYFIIYIYIFIIRCAVWCSRDFHLIWEWP